MKDLDVYQDATLKLISGSWKMILIILEYIQLKKRRKGKTKIYEIFKKSGLSKLKLNENTQSTYAFLTSSSFKWPVRGRPRIALSGHDPTAYGSSLDSLSLERSHSSVLWLVQSDFSLHSNPNSELRKVKSPLKDQVYHFFLNTVWKIVSGWSKSSEKIFLNLPVCEKRTHEGKHL